MTETTKDSMVSIHINLENLTLDAAMENATKYLQLGQIVKNVKETTPRVMNYSFFRDFAKYVMEEAPEKYVPTLKILERNSTKPEVQKLLDDLYTLFPSLKAKQTTMYH